MKLNIGDTIKHFRIEKDITQDELGDILGVSYQSISRWETGICYPDMELLPVISDFFGVTVDNLLSINKNIEQEKIAQYLFRFQEAISQGKVYDCIAIAREGVAEYPNNFALLNKLMYALFIVGDDDGNIPEWKENMEKYDAEITALGERIMKYCPDQDIRLEATARLAFNHCEMGRKEIGRAIYETLPPFEFCKENQMWWGLNDDEKLPFIREKIRKGYELLSAGIYSLINYRQMPDEELLNICEKQWKLDDLIYDGKIEQNDWRNARLRCHCAAAFARLGKYNDALDQLKIAVKYANDFDNRPDEIVMSSLLLGETTIKKIDFETDDTRPLSEIMRDKWLSSPDFDKLRNTDDFIEIMKLL